MGSFSIWHWLVVGVIVLLLFGGKGKISDLMGDFAKGIKSFKKGMQDEDETAKAPAQAEPVRNLEQPAPVQATAAPQPAPAHPAPAHPVTEPPKAG
jgi:sec-independent protein translocase protein TatA